MDLHGIGYSNIRLPNDQNSYIYTYDSRANTFPEEVFIHEFLHSLERTLTEYEYDLPQSTLLMLVSALADKEFILQAYNEAVKEKYRFFSFGDAMLII